MHTSANQPAFIDQMARHMERYPGRIESKRTGSNPLHDLAKRFNMPLETIYCYAWYLRRRKLNINGLSMPVAPSLWDHGASNQFWRHFNLADLDQNQQAQKLSLLISEQVSAFLVTQGHLVAKP
jgi:hypothetical protein